MALQPTTYTEEVGFFQIEKRAVFIARSLRETVWEGTCGPRHIREIARRARAIKGASSSSYAIARSILPLGSEIKSTPAMKAGFGSPVDSHGEYDR